MARRFTRSRRTSSTRADLADLLADWRPSRCTIFREGSGCYGHSGSDDAAADAALLSQAVGRPVRVQWMRADELAWEPKSPPMTMDLRGGLDDQGNVIAWDYEVWTPTAQHPSLRCCIEAAGRAVEGSASADVRGWLRRR